MQQPAVTIVLGVLLVLRLSSMRRLAVAGLVLLLIGCAGSDDVEPTQVAAVAPTSVPTTPPLEVPTVTPVPTPTSAPVPAATATPLPVPTATLVPAPTATAAPEPTTAAADSGADAAPEPTSAPDPTAVPTAVETPTPIPTSTPIPTPTPEQGDDPAVGTGVPPVSESPTAVVAPSGGLPLECYDRNVQVYRGFVEGIDSLSFEIGRVYCNASTNAGVSAARSYRHQSGLVVQRSADFLFNSSGTGYINYSGFIHFCLNGQAENAPIVADTVPQLLIVIDNETRNQIAQGAVAPGSFTASGTAC